MNEDEKKITNLVNAVYDDIEKHFDMWHLIGYNPDIWSREQKNTRITFRIGISLTIEYMYIDDICLTEAQTNAINSMLTKKKVEKEKKDQEESVDKTLKMWGVK